MNTRGIGIALNALLGATFIGTVAVASVAAPTSGADIVAAPNVPTVPQWKPAYAEQFPGCTPTQATEPGDLVVIDQDAHVSRVDFGTAWKANHNDVWADDVWVVGWCR